MKPFARPASVCRGKLGRPKSSSAVVLFALVCLAATASMPGALALAADDDSQPQGRRFAILIGIANYENVTPLPCCENDVEQLAATLFDRGSYETVKIPNSAGPTDSQSESQAMEEKIGKHLSELGPNDTALVYFSGHGLFHEDVLYLAQIDCDPADPASGGIPADRLRELLDSCKAKHKLLIIDACYGGSEKAIAEPKSMFVGKSQAKGGGERSVVTLASSRRLEESFTWSEKRQSLFSYWVNQGLKGHADENGNGDVTIDELYEFVHENVLYVAGHHLQQQQTPVRIIHSGTTGVPVIISLNPQTLKGLLDNIAEQLATEMQVQGLTRVAVPEFAADAGSRILLGGSFGALGRYCAEELEGRLMKRSAHKFDVVEHKALHRQLAAKGIGITDLRGGKIQDLEVDGKDTPVHVAGTLRNRTGRVITLQCKLLDLKGGKNFGTAGGMAALNESEWAMLGGSAVVSDLPGPAPTVDTPRRVDPVELLDSEARKDHPLKDPNAPYRIEIIADGKVRQGEFVGNNMFVPLSEDEVFWIKAYNPDPEMIYLRLLVDGRNTLPEKAKAKVVLVDPANGEADTSATQRVNFAEAQAWQMDANAANGIYGFYTKVASDPSEDSLCDEFKVADAASSPLEREYFGDKLGTITAIFYAEPGGTRGLMVKPGRQLRQKVRLYEDTGVGNVLATITIHYVTPQALAKMKPQ